MISWLVTGPNTYGPECLQPLIPIDPNTYSESNELKVGIKGLPTEVKCGIATYLTEAKPS